MKSTSLRSISSRKSSTLVRFKDEKINPTGTPASGILFKHTSNPELDPKDAPFNCRSAIGSLNHLAQTTRPDISLAVHQCARFCNNPKQAHFTAVKRIVRYLIKTQDKGMILNVKDPMIECFADADFAGSWDKQDPLDPENVKSRTGFIIKFAGCPIQWGSKIQELISLSRWKQNALLSAMPPEMFFTFFICWKNSRRTTLILICQELRFMPNVMRTTQVVWSLLRHPSCAQEQSTLQSNVITFYHMSKPRKTQVGCSTCNGSQQLNNKLTFSPNLLLKKTLKDFAPPHLWMVVNAWKQSRGSVTK